MTQHWLGQQLDIIGDDIITPADRRARLRGAVQRQRAARACAKVDIFVMACGGHERDDIIFDQLIDKYVLDTLLQIQQLLGRNHLFDRVDRVRLALAAQDLDLIELLGVAKVHAQLEAVELGLGQRESALVLDRVLGRQHNEGRW
jgi:hypothetical protein